jgi:hypothetical protein
MKCTLFTLLTALPLMAQCPFEILSMGTTLRFQERAQDPADNARITIPRVLRLKIKNGGKGITGMKFAVG